uniref:Sortilin-related VPS10 domain containing receptor 2 n=1 Tax=Astyanax mexicanus TaxID=7994 RepID=A0A8B9GQE8_ASTMX
MGNRTKHYVSYRRNEFVQMRFPKYALPKDVQVVSTDENQVLLALQEWYQTETYNLYESDPQGFYYSLVLENVRSTKQPEENVLIDVLEVRGIKGVFLANQKVDGKVTTLITYNKGRDWEPLTPPTTDLNGKSVNCKEPDCHLHLHLRWADNPYVSGTVHTKDSAPGLIMGAGNLGSQLVEYKEEMYITADCGRSWRQVFEEEHHILYLDHGGVIVAIKDTSIPLKILKFSVDEGRTWSVHNFTSTSVFVDGLLSEPGDETLGEQCIMGQERTYRRRKDSSLCIKGKSYTSALTAKPCPCSEKDFNCDYGFERAPTLKAEGDRCYPDFWHDPDAPPDTCHIGHTYESSTGYRKVVSNMCEGGTNKEQSAKQHSCPLLPPRGLQLGIKGQMLTVAPGDDITFVVHQEQGDTSSTRYQVDLWDGVRAIYENLTVTDEPIQHRYEKPGVYRVSVQAENSAGYDRASLYIQVTNPLQEVHLEVVPIAGRNQQVNLTAVVLPADTNLTVFYWWIGNDLQVHLPYLLFLVCFSLLYFILAVVFITLYFLLLLLSDRFQVIHLSFSPILDRFNPNIPEWREDVGHVVNKILAKVAGVPQDCLVTMVKPGIPTTAQLYILPPEGVTAKRNAFVDKVSIYTHTHTLCYTHTHTHTHHISTCLLVVVIGGLTRPWLRFRKLPGRNVYAQMHNEKEQEMTSPVNHSDDTQNIIQGEEHKGVLKLLTGNLCK